MLPSKLGALGISAPLAHAPRKNTKDSARFRPGAALRAIPSEMSLGLRTPYPPMEALSVDEIPAGPEWQYEPKWDGFRCLVFRDGKDVQLQSKAGQPLTRYFPELVEAILALEPKKFVLDGEIVIPTDGGVFSFDALLQRIHPAASRVKKLAAETPSMLLIFDLLVNTTGANLTGEPLSERRQALEQFAEKYLDRDGDI